MKIFVKTIIITFAIFIGAFLFFGNETKADMAGLSTGGSLSATSSIKTYDATADKNADLSHLLSQKSIWQNKLFDTLSYVWKEAGSNAASAALRYALNTIAYDTATWLGSGGKGQKPMFIKEGWGEYFRNVADNAAGVFIEDLGRTGLWGEKFNLCNPNLGVKMRILGGLVNQQRPKAPACTFSKMIENWERELKSDNFLDDFKAFYDFSENDLGIALILHTRVIEEKELATKESDRNLLTNQRWLDSTSAISGDLKSVPGFSRDILRGITDMATLGFSKAYPDPFVEAINIFQTQLAYTALMNALGKIAENKPRTSSPYNYSLLDFEGVTRGGVSAAKDKFRILMEPNFSIRGDYNILAELTNCQDPNNAGPTNCVIEEKFRQAIEKKITVGQAIEMGHLNSSGIFGYDTTGKNLNYKDNHYPYRSMIILRKFRILPVGWEVAAQYINENPAVGVCTLGDMVACFDDETYGGHISGRCNFNINDNIWCKGLVDPQWVLKAPLNYCKREGPGPEIISTFITGEKTSSKLNIDRNNKYCADEQSCIKENNDGSCQKYGYCIEDRRSWNFNNKSCDPRFNTCQTFRAEKGQTVSYLKNTLDFSVCNSGNAGCAEYAQAIHNIYDLDYDRLDWSSTNERMYFDNNAEKCSEKAEGCHRYIKTEEDESEQIIYQKMLPIYLEPVCYNNLAGDYRYIVDAPAKCYQYGKKCRDEDVGCEMLTSTTRKFKISSVPPVENDCLNECVGYNQYSQSATYFESNKSFDFIPKTAIKCSSNAVGCEEFTNLDKIDLGGEAREYYKRLKICEKPNSGCAEFYTWEGSDEQGYQLKVYF
jgi:hypothetical protein